MFPGLTDEILASYTINAKISQLNNFHVDYIPDFVTDILKGLLEGHKFEDTLNVPKMCIANEICLSGFEAVIREGFIEAIADVAFKPLRREIQ